jgi:D-alanyl-D-alanine carboxypeptidase
VKKQAIDKSLKYIDSWLQFRYERTEMPGYAVAIAFDGKIIYDKAFGYANLETKERLTSNHLFRIASHSKTFTATAIMQLVEEGILELDDQVTKYIPWLINHKDTRFQKITIRQVMSHGAGIIRDGLNADYWQVMEPFPDEQTFKKAVLEADLVLENNLKLKYSNFGYSLLGLVIEEVSGEPYNDFVLNRIIKPLHLNNTGPEYIPAINNRLVTGYTRRDVKKNRLPIAKSINTNALSPATGFYSNAADLCTYFSAHFTGSGDLLSDESKKEMQKAYWQAQETHEKEDYGLGLEIYFIKNHRVFGHSGGFPGHSTNSFCDPEADLVVVVLTNCIDGTARLISRGILSNMYYFEKNAPITKPKHDLSKFEGRFVSLWDMVDIVATGNKIVGAFPDSWFPFIRPEKLEYIDNKTLKVGKTNSFMSEGELVNFNFDNKGHAISLKYTGATMLPADEYFKQQAKLKFVG